MNTQQLKEKIEEKYGSLDDECGCYGGNSEWLSVKNIVNLIDQCDSDGELDADELKDLIEDKYGDLDDEAGCYVHNDWLSVKDIVDLIDECDDGDD